MPAATSMRSTQGRGRLFDSILDTVGDTPAIRVNNLAIEGRTIYVKAEFFNPASSVKDRLALNVIEAAERAGTLRAGQTVVEATRRAQLPPPCACPAPRSINRNSCA